MASYKIYENGKLIKRIAASKKEWEEIVTGMNTSMDVVDAPHQAIKVVRDDGKIVYEQHRSMS